MEYAKKIFTPHYFFLSIIATTSLFLGSNNIAIAATNKAIAEEMTTLFRSARAVISKNQSLINDASKGDKGLSGDMVVKNAKTNYKSTTGQALDDSNTAVKAMLGAIRNSMNQAQPVINEKGTGFKGFLPAIFARQVADSFNAKMKGKMRIKLTVEKRLVRNRANRPDKWESSIIQTKFLNPDYPRGRPVAEAASYKGKIAFRYILPEYYKESCLGCHGGPKGDIDITGGRKEGGKLGELGGAVSFTIF